MADENRAAADRLASAAAAGDGALSTVSPYPGGAGDGSGRTSGSGSGSGSGRTSETARERAAAAELMSTLARRAYDFDFFQVLRRLECYHRDKPRLGRAPRLADEPIRLGQEPTLAFAPTSLARLAPGREGGPPWLLVYFFGLFGPNGPLPLHLTEYARDRLRNADDPTMTRFCDVFHHRLLLLFYRAWADGEPTVSRDRPESDVFAGYTASLAGLMLEAFHGRDEFPDTAKLFFVGRLSGQTRNADGLGAMVGDYFKMPARIEQFMGTWLDLPIGNRWALGKAPRGILGGSSVLGAHVWGCQQKFRITLGPLTRPQFERMLPGGGGLPVLRALVRNYIGDELRWDVRMFLEQRTEEKMTLGRSRVGWTSWLGRAPSGWREDLILDPQADIVTAAA
jgi:type VI secretion system protein ImpH